jgi:hypothetical protein
MVHAVCGGQILSSFALHVKNMDAYSGHFVMVLHVAVSVNCDGVDRRNNPKSSSDPVAGNTYQKLPLCMALTGRNIKAALATLKKDFCHQ